MAERPRRPMRSVLVWDLLLPAVDKHAGGLGVDTLDILDAGGGTGGFAVPLAERGHRVTVVDPSPDALAALERRAAEAGVTELVTAVQGDAAEVAEVVAPESVDLVLCHGVLAYVDDAPAAVAGVAATLRPGGLASLLVAQRLGAVLARAVAGHFLDARRVLDSPTGHWGGAGPVPRRFTQDEVLALLAAASLVVQETAGVRVFADLVPGLLVDADPAAVQALRELERAVAHDPRFAAIAAHLHVLARRESGD